ncbi:MAG TPA: CHAT domain-containing protein [Pyrinomonadaceae bacterium]|nr:CHAT domain-containing protein [Pyrinomonadaceae bacterium]
MITILVIGFCVSLAEAKAQGATRSTDQKISEAQEATDRAAKLRATWTKARLQEAILEYEKAALLWISASDFSHASEATLSSGDLFFLFSDYREALKRFQRAEAFAERAGDWLARANALSRIGRLQSFIGKNELAQQYLTRALELFNQHQANRNENTSNAYGEALGNLAEVNYAKGDFMRAREQFKSALEALKNDSGRAAKIHIFNGYISGSLGDSKKAKQEISQAQKLYQQVNDKVGEALATTALGLVYSHNLDHPHAIELHKSAIEIFRTAGDRHSEALSLNALGTSYLRARQYELALNQYEQALRLFEEIGSVEGTSEAALQIAGVNFAIQHLDQAQAFCERSIRLSRLAGSVRSEINALMQLAAVYAAQGRRELALAEYQKILRFYKNSDLRARAMALNAYADFLLQIGDNRRALETCLKALALSEQIDDKEILTPALYNLARAHLAVGSPDVALSVIRRSLDMIEDVRANVTSPDFRVSYLSGVGKHYGLCIQILMQLDRERPGNDFAALALLVSEKGRARLMLDLIRESRAVSSQEAVQELFNRERELRNLFEILAQYRMNLFLSRKDSAEIAAIDNQVAQLKADYQMIQAEKADLPGQPYRKRAEQMAPLTLQQIKSELRDDNTMLLEYSLGDERSYLWAVTSNSFQSYELPARQAIEDAARECYKLITAPQETVGPGSNDYQKRVEAAARAYPEKAMNLSRMLLGPVADQLGKRRLLVVTEGALQHIPLGALPVPASENGSVSKFLIEEHEVVALPSFSALIAIRSTRNRAGSPKKLLAVIADPVFSGSDDRVQREQMSRGIAQAATGDNPETRRRDGTLARLSYASEEADSISATAPWGTTLVAKGFDANRDLAMSSDIGQYQILHFATHGFIDSDHPELSSIVLSTVDRNGNETNGLMPLYDIYSLDLSAELTVLSACQTALGKDIKGEGLIGLTHSFMSAGSNTVVATLWEVDDKATAVLMADFYEAMLQKGMSPAAALRSAQLRMIRDKQRSAPYYWAGFVLQGEYANRIVVDNNSSLRLALALLFLLGLIAAGFFVLQKRRRRFSPPR